MDVKEAVTTAKQYVADLFSNEGVSNLGLEEVDYDEGEGVWNITLGFSRAWDNAPDGFASFAAQQLFATKRTYKIVRVKEQGGKVLSVRNRETIQ